MTHALKNIIKHILRQAMPIAMPIMRHTICRRFPPHLSMTVPEAETKMKRIHPDTGATCLCRNKISPVADLHIIIPAYNTRPYLRDCLDSVYRQHTRFSIFITVIDDGSTDGTAELLDRYVSDIRETAVYQPTEVIHQPNGGPAAARNKALGHIRGRYVTFLDSDDRLLPGAIESLMSRATGQRADIAEGHTHEGATMHGMACGKIYDARLFAGLRFPPSYIFEDTINIFFLYPICRKRIKVPGRHYFYRNNRTSVMHSFQGRPRAVEALWVSRRVLADYFASGHRPTQQLLADYIGDALSTASVIHTLRSEEAMQACFVILADMAHTYFRAMLSDRNTMALLPRTLRHAATALVRKDYRHFRAALASACRF